MKTIFIFSLLFISLQFVFSNPGYKINIQITGAENSIAIIGHYLNKSMYPDDSITLDNQGRGVFQDKTSLPQGMYFIFLPSSKYFDFILGEDQDFDLKTDTSNLSKNIVVAGSVENQIFFEFQKYMLDKRQELDKLSEIIKTSENKKDTEKAKEKLKEINKERIDKIKKLKVDQPGLFVTAFLNATLDVEVPESVGKKDGKVDSIQQYNYYRVHYFDNLDISDARFLRTPLYEDKIMYYLEKVVPPIPDTLIKEVDFLIEKSKNDSSLFRYMLITLFNYYGKSNIMGMDAIQVHIADKYYITSAWWSDQKFITDLEERVKILKPLLLSQVAPNIQLRYVPSDHFIAAKDDTTLKRYPHVGSFFNIHDIQADFIVLLFWEANCSHCKTAVPELYKIYKDSLQSLGVKVIAISTLFGEDGKEKWIDFVNNHQLYDWINAWNPYDYQFKIIYDVRSTPQIFILNKEKKIIGKRIGVENIVGLIKAYSKINSN